MRFTRIAFYSHYSHNQMNRFLLKITNSTLGTVRVRIGPKLYDVCKIIRYVFGDVISV